MTVSLRARCRLLLPQEKTVKSKMFALIFWKLKIYKNMDLRMLGWDFYKESLTEKIEGDNVARVAIENRGGYLLYSEYGELEGIIQGKFMRSASSEIDYPKVGDWVLIEKLSGENKAIIKKVLPRISKISRKRAGEDVVEQIIATNIDIAFIVQGLDGDFNIGRIERYVTMAKEGGCEPIILLNKCDILSDNSEKLKEIQQLFLGVKIFLVSAVSKYGIDDVAALVAVGRSVVFVGSSGVGKSTLINALLGTDRQKTDDIRTDDSKGRHTTTKRELIVLPSGGLLIDTPGMRELGLWASESSLNEAFEDIEAFAKLCKFNDCDHQFDKGCAVVDAFKNGLITGERYQRYLKLKMSLDPFAAKKQSHDKQAQKRSQRTLIKRAEYSKDK
jgi:ribosome biogenesis GTPase